MMRDVRCGETPGDCTNESSADRLDVARRWAALLDADAFDEAATLLAPRCVYESPGGVVTGVREIIDTYQRNAAWARATFDDIEWASTLAPQPEDSCVCITFVDTIRHRGVEHRYSCRQVIRIDAAGRIDRIEHRVIPSEESALQAFFDRVGVRRWNIE